MNGIKPYTSPILTSHSEYDSSNIQCNTQFQLLEDPAKPYLDVRCINDRVEGFATTSTSTTTNVEHACSGCGCKAGIEAMCKGCRDGMCSDCGKEGMCKGCREGMIDILSTSHYINTEAMSNLYPAEYKPNWDVSTQLYIGSISIVGLYILFQLLYVRR